MGINEIVTMLASIGTLGALIISIFTLAEIKKQRLNSMMPDIVLRRQNFFVYHSILKNRPYDSLVFSEVKIIDDNEPESSNYYLFLENIGIGAAKQISILWDYNTEEIIHAIKSLDEENQYSFEVSEACLRIDRKNKEDALDYSALIMESEENIIEYILSTSVAEKTSRIQFPNYYITLLSILLKLMACNIEKKKNILLPKIAVSISYTDIGGIKYEKKYELNFQLHLLRKLSVLETEEIASGILIAKPLS